MSVNRPTWNDGRGWILSSAGIVLLLLLRAQGQILITNQATFAYTNNFNSLASSGTPIWTDNSTMLGWYAGTATSGANSTISNYRTGTGSSATGGFYSYGSSGNSDRAFGALHTIGSATNAAFGIRLRNTSGTTVTNITVAFTGEQWRRAATGGGNQNQTLTVSYRVSGSNITSADPANTSSWTNIAALTFDSPVDTRSGSGAALNGNSAANRVSLQAQFNVVLPSGSEIFIRWVDFNDANNDHGLAIDDVRIYVPEMGTIGPLTLVGALAVGGFLRRRHSRRTAAKSVTHPS